MKDKRPYTDEEKRVLRNLAEQYKKGSKLYEQLIKSMKGEKV